jgi:hypothetical protein
LLIVCVMTKRDYRPSADLLVERSELRVFQTGCRRRRDPLQPLTRVPKNGR